MTKYQDKTPAGVPAGVLKVTLGPLLYHWTPERFRDFYAAIADEAPVNTVHLGETVCSKREPFLAETIPAVVERLEAAGKEVVRSAPLLVVSERERKALKSLLGDSLHLIEANETGCVALLQGRDHALGPGVNVYNEGTLAWFARQGATRVCLNAELPRSAIEAIGLAARDHAVEMEVQVFGRAPLAISSRCYHARSRGLHKDGCGFACGEDADGLALETMDGTPFLAVNGTQTLTDTFVMLGGELGDMVRLGVRRFRLSPHTLDMVSATRTVRAALDGRLDPAEAAVQLTALVPGGRVSNGFYHRREGWRYFDQPPRRPAKISQTVRSAVVARPGR